MWYARHVQKLIGLLNKADGAENFENAIISVIPKVLAQLCRLKINVKINVKKTFLVGTVREDILGIQHQKQVFPDFTLPDLVEIAKKIEEIEGKQKSHAFLFKSFAERFEKIKKNDTGDYLYARLKKKENALYVEALQKLATI